MANNLNKMRAALLTGLLVCAADINAQIVKGTITDKSGEPIIGATVQEVGLPGNGTVTDLDGKFSIDMKGGKKTLKISYVGMKTQTVTVGNRSSLSIKMEDDANNLNDVVVIGYGSVKRKDLTGSVATVDNKSLVEVPVASAEEALTGKLAGVQVSTSEGSPDATVKIRVRGGGSITQSNDPLFIVDGFPVDDISNIPALGSAFCQRGCRFPQAPCGCGARQR